MYLAWECWEFWIWRLVAFNSSEISWPCIFKHISLHLKNQITLCQIKTHWFLSQRFQMFYFTTIILLSSTDFIFRQCTYFSSCALIFFSDAYKWAHSMSLFLMFFIANICLLNCCHLSFKTCLIFANIPLRHQVL